MTVKMSITYRCNHSGCKQSFTYDKPDASKFTTDQAASKAGWYRKNAEEQYCPGHADTHRGVMKEPAGSKKPAKSGKKKTLISSVAKKKGPKVFEFSGKKPETSSEMSDVQAAEAGQL